MIRKSNNVNVPVSKTTRCAIYTRKSTEEGLEQEFNSLDAQREAGEAYIASQRHEGWQCLSQRYDDGGFSGGNLERPAMRRLLADIEAGQIDVVVVYKVDRLSRSLLDFARIMQTLDGHKVSFVSVTQQFNTTHSMGRLTLNILLSFAQFEREIISERTRDKIAATRRKGKWSGGLPLLGYHVKQGKLLVDAEEARQVRGIFSLYRDKGSLLATAEELNRRGWRTKAWITKKGKRRGGRPWDRGRVHLLLTNVAYRGQVRYKTEVHPGEHEAIVAAGLWQDVQRQLAQNCVPGQARRRHAALLSGRLRCAACDAAMSHNYTVKRNKRYRYYVCCAAQKRGWDSCSTKSVPAGEIERIVVEQIRAIGRDPSLVAATMAELRRRGETERQTLETEAKRLAKELARHGAQIRALLRSPNAETPERLAELEGQTAKAELRLREVRSKLQDQQTSAFNEAEVGAALAQFDAVWEALSPSEQSRLVELLIERVDYDGAAGTLAIHFHESGLESLIAEEALA
jgi:site-specific DNA recombinase